jgi:hypothetical protein
MPDHRANRQTDIASRKAADGSYVNMSGTTADVARRGPDGWKYVIDNPFGTV